MNVLVAHFLLTEECASKSQQLPLLLSKGIAIQHAGFRLHQAWWNYPTQVVAC